MTITETIEKSFRECGREISHDELVAVYTQKAKDILTGEHAIHAIGIAAALIMERIAAFDSHTDDCVVKQSVGELATEAMDVLADLIVATGKLEEHVKFSQV